MQISVINASLTNGPIVHKAYFQFYSELPHENTNLVLVMLRVGPADVAGTDSILLWDNTPCQQGSHKHMAKCSAETKHLMLGKSFGIIRSDLESQRHSLQWELKAPNPSVMSL